jgi:uracil-DNA glycosylase
MPPEEQISLFNLTQPIQEALPADFNAALIPTSAQMPIPSGTYQSIEEMVPHCTTCHRCELGQYRTHAVIGRGNPTADVLIVGEGPGQSEDEQGLPFVGRSGQLLEKILESVHFNSEKDVYICNIVKCRPPDNRTPTPDEAEACKPYLLEQIRIVNPKIILLTGATAVRGLTGDKRGITKIRGQWIEWQGYLCMPIFHPAYLLRNPSREPNSPKWLMWKDIQAVRTKLAELSPPPSIA